MNLLSMNMPLLSLKKLLPLCLGMSMLTGCQSAIDNAYYGAWEKVGVHKRDIMVDRVEAASESQEEAKQQFNSALEQLQFLLNHDGGDLQRAYETTKDEYEMAQQAATNVTERIDAVENVANALFREWQGELELINKASLRRASETKLRETKRNYEQLLRSMRVAESKMQPVLVSMKDNMLYLKHNLNAQAIGAIQGEFNSLQAEINTLITEMNRSIAESNRFINALDQAK